MDRLGLINYDWSDDQPTCNTWRLEAVDFHLMRVTVNAFGVATFEGGWSIRRWNRDTGHGWTKPVEIAGERFVVWTNSNGPVTYRARFGVDPDDEIVIQVSEPAERTGEALWIRGELAE